MDKKWVRRVRGDPDGTTFLMPEERRFYNGRKNGRETLKGEKVKRVMELEVQ